MNYNVCACVCKRGLRDRYFSTFTSAFRNGIEKVRDDGKRKEERHHVVHVVLTGNRCRASGGGDAIINEHRIVLAGRKRT